MKTVLPEITRTFVYLQYLRGAAALMVVYFHSVLQLKNLGISTPILPLVGEAGVDLFFVLSGFLMWITTSVKAVSPVSFMLNRLIRIVPLYWMLTISAGFVALILPSLLKNTVFEASHFIASLAFFPFPNPAYLNSSDKAVSITPLLVPGWTLNYEIFFYAIFAFALCFSKNLRFILVIFAFGIVTLAGWLLGDVSSLLNFYSNSIIFEFVLGIGVAILVQRLWLLNVQWASLLVLFAMALMLLASYEGMVLNRVVAFGIPATLIVYGLCCIEIHIAARNFLFLRIIGDASYSLYLTHVFALVLSRLIFRHLNQTHTLMTELIFIALCMFLSLTIGILTYYLYENPTSKWLKRLKAKLNMSF